jgi:hypothetical protein
MDEYADVFERTGIDAAAWPQDPAECARMLVRALSSGSHTTVTDYRAGLCTKLCNNGRWAAEVHALERSLVYHQAHQEHHLRVSALHHQYLGDRLAQLHADGPDEDWEAMQAHLETVRTIRTAAQSALDDARRVQTYIEREQLEAIRTDACLVQLEMLR